MAKHAFATRLVPAPRSVTRDESSTEKLNRHVLQTIHELAEEIKADPGIEDEYEFELFGDAGPTKPKKKSK